MYPVERVFSCSSPGIPVLHNAPGNVTLFFSDVSTIATAHIDLTIRLYRYHTEPDDRFDKISNIEYRNRRDFSFICIVSNPILDSVGHRTSSILVGSIRYFRFIDIAFRISFVFSFTNAHNNAAATVPSQHGLLRAMFTLPVF